MWCERGVKWSENVWCFWDKNNNCKRKKSYCDAYITLWIIEDNLLIMERIIQLWNEWDENRMFNEEDEKVWYS